MAAKDINYNVDARSALKRGVDKLADAVKVLPVPTVVALVVKVVDVELAAIYGPSVKVISDKVQLVCPVLVSLLTS